MDNHVRLIETSKGRIEYTIKGEGDPILMLHGSLDNCNSDMGYESLLKAGFSIITPSRPGYGNTPTASGKSAEEAADLINELLIYLHIDSVNVVAVSYGGPTGLHFAARYPEKVRRLVLVSAVTRPIDDEKKLKQAKKFYGRGHKFLWNMLNTIGRISKASIVKQTYRIFSTFDVNEIMKEIKPQDIEAILKFYRKRPENLGGLNDLEHIAGRDTFKKISSPTLIVHSKEDNAVSYDQAEYANKMIENSELFTAKTWGHFVFIGKGSAEVIDKAVSFMIN